MIKVLFLKMIFKNKIKFNFYIKMSFMARLFVYQAIFVFVGISLYGNLDLQSNELKDSLLYTTNKFGFEFLNEIIDLYSKFILIAFLSSELILSIIALLGCRLFGFIVAFIVLAHGLIKYNPLIAIENSKKSNSVTSNILFDIQYELVLIFGVFISILISSTCQAYKPCTTNEVPKSEEKSKDAVKEKSENKSTKKKIE
jgi:hypothetical protein